MSNTITDPKILFHSSKILLLHWKTGKLKCLYLPVEAKCIDPSIRLPKDKPLVISEARVDDQLNIHYRIGTTWYPGKYFELNFLSVVQDSLENIFSSRTGRLTA